MSRPKLSRVSQFKGVECPVSGCDAEVHVANTRKAENAIYRYRVCERGHKFWTLEGICPEPDRELQRKWNHPERLMPRPKVKQRPGIGVGWMGSKAEEAANVVDHARDVRAAGEPAGQEEGEAAFQQRE